MIGRIAFLIVSLFGISLVTGCSPYVDGFFYAPHPAVAEVRVATTQPSQAAPSPLTTYATVVGVRRENRDEHIPLSIEVRLRLDNHGTQAVTFDPRTLDLTNGELVRFPPPMVAQQAISVLPERPVMVQANFPFPPGLSYDSLNIQTLQLRWVVEIDGHPVTQFADFRRSFRYYDDPYWGYGPYGYGYPYPDYGYPYYGIGGTFIIRR